MLPEELALRLEKIRNSLDSVQRSALLRVLNSYKSTTRYLDSDIDLLVKELSGGQLSVADVQKLKAYKRLMGNTAEALQQFAAYLGVDMRSEIDKMASMGQRDAFALLLAQGSILQGVLNRGANEAQLRALINYLDPGKPLYNRLQQYSQHNAEYISQMILEGVRGGYNPATIARSIRDAYGMGLTDAMRMMRTVQIYSYRDASHLNYQNNRDVVDGWVWFAKLDGKTCMSCISMHGTFHSVDEKLNDHHNGRCVAVPITKLSGEFLSEGAGKEWFESQPEGVQKQMMGVAKWDAWKAGKFDISQLSKERDNDVFGLMRNETPLKDLIGEP
jgi:SPP1 gp7 family putative phage head morphogenesis protein